jgi:cytoskeletal protein CcmA (bactofilin family)
MSDIITGTNFILPASTREATKDTVGAVKIDDTTIKMNANGELYTSTELIKSVDKLNAQIDVDNNGTARIKRTEGATIVEMQKYITVWVKSHKFVNNGVIDNNAYSYFMTGTGTAVTVSVPSAANLTAAGITNADLTACGLTAGSPIPRFLIKYPDGLNEIFVVQDKSGSDLFAVRANGDAVVAGTIEIAGSGLSKFNGDVEIGGHLTVMQGATVNGLLSGNNFEITGNLKVDGNTYLGNNATEDHTEILGYASIKHQYNADTIQDLVDTKIAAWKTAHTGWTIAQLNAYRIGPASAGAGNSLAADVAEYVDIFAVQDSTGKAVFAVKPNGDTIIAGVLSVNGAGESYFEGDVNINGSLVVNKDATVKGVMTGNDFQVQGNLKVLGNTQLGDDPAADVTVINGVTTVNSAILKYIGSSTINVFEILSPADYPSVVEAFTGKYNIAVTLLNKPIVPGSAKVMTIDGVTTYVENTDYSIDYGNGAITIKNSNLNNVRLNIKYKYGTVNTNKQPLFEVKQNGDAVIAGKLTVNSTGTTLAGDVSIGGALTVHDGITTGTTMNLGHFIGQRL